MESSGSFSNTTTTSGSVNQSTWGSIIGMVNNSTNSSDNQVVTQDTLQHTTLSQIDLNSIVNVTREYPFEYATVMFGYIMPVILVITIVTNIFVVIVLMQRHMKTPTNIVLLTMAVVDLSTLISPAPWYFYIYTLGTYSDEFLYPPWACYVHHVMTDVIPIFFHTSSIWLALLLASQRYIYVCHPTLARTWCTVPRVRKAILLIIAVAFLHQLSRFFDNTFESVELVINGRKEKACQLEISSWVKDIHPAFYYTTYFGFRILFVFVIPCVALITLNCLLFRALQRAKKRRSELLGTKFKHIGGERCSAVGLQDIKRSSYVDINCNNQHPGREVSSTGFLMANNNKTSTSSALIRNHFAEINQTQGSEKTAKQANNNDRNSIDKSENFSITLYQSSNQLGRNKSELHDLSKLSSPTNHVRDTKVITSAQEEQGHGEIANSSYTKRRSSFKKASKESSDSSSVEARNAKVAKTPHIRSRESVSIEEIDVADEEEPEEDNNDEDYEYQDHSIREEEDEEITCPECATCEADTNCQHCAMMTRDGATSRHNHCHRHNHPAMSQCSSLVEGATNTTTNDEDASSCAIAHNASSSMYVIHDRNSGAVETASMNDINDRDRRNISLQNIGLSLAVQDYSSEKLAKGSKENEQLLSRSDSVDSRLVCGCLVSRSVSLRHGHKSPGGRKRQCKECYPQKNPRNSSPIEKDRVFHRNTSFSASRKLSRNRHSDCAASCSNSDPCINCNSETYQTTESREPKDMAHIVGGDGSKSPVVASQSYNARGAVGNVENPYEESNQAVPACTNATTTTTTTTTTLYSTKTNSNGSLVQALTTQPTTNSPKTLGVIYADVHSSARMKSPSIASVTGRGSKATLGIGYAGPTVSSNMGSSNARNMDSNRTTLMLIVVVTVFLVVEVPVAISHILHVVFNTFEVFNDIEFASSLNYIKLFTNFFIMLSYSVNFTIYCSMSKKFRETFRDLILCRKRAKQKRGKRSIYQPQQSQFTQHHFNIQDTQLNSHVVPENHMTSSPANSGPISVKQNNFAQQSGCINRNNHPSAGVLRYSPYKRASSDQQECEL